MSDTKGWVQGPGHWLFVPEGALVHREQRIIVLADLHLGYEDARSAKGDFLPIRSTHETLTRLRRLIYVADAKRIVVAGDIIESAVASSHRSDRIGEFLRGLEAMNVESIFLKGNHDVGCSRIDMERFIVDGWLIRHGHDQLRTGSSEAQKEIYGHLHPVLRWKGHTYRAFLSSPDQILLPAFSCDAAGGEVTDSHTFPDGLWSEHECLVCLRDSVLSFGTLNILRSKLASL